MENPYKNMTDEEFYVTVKGCLKAKENGARLEPLVPYAKEIRKELDNVATINDCINITYYDFEIELMKRFIENQS